MDGSGLCDYMSDLTEENIQAFLLKVLGTFYPFLADLTVGLDAPVLVEVQGRSCFTQLLTYLRGFGLPDVKDVGATPSEFEKSLVVPEYSLLIFGYSETRYTGQNLETLFSFSRELRWNAEALPLILVVDDGRIPHYYLEDFAGGIFLQSIPTKKTSDEEFTKGIIRKIIQYQELVKNELQEIKDESSEIEIFEAAVACLNMILADSAAIEMNEFNTLAQEGIRQIRENWEMDNDPEAYAEAFRILTSGFFGNTDKVPPLLNRMRISGDETRFTEEAIFYDDNFYYFPEAVFQEICQPLIDRDGKGLVLAQLEDAGIIECDHGDRLYGTKKVEIVNVFGVTERKRRVKIRRAQMDNAKDLSLLDLVSIRRGGKDSESNHVGEKEQCRLLCPDTI